MSTSRPNIWRSIRAGRCQALALDDGTVLTESVAICRYLEGLQPAPPLFGTGALEQAQVEMWSRRAEMILMAPVGAVWVHTHRFTAAIPGRNAEWGEANRPRVIEAMGFFDLRCKAGPSSRWTATRSLTSCC